MTENPAENPWDLVELFRERAQASRKRKSPLWNEAYEQGKAYAWDQAADALATRLNRAADALP